MEDTSYKTRSRIQFLSVENYRDFVFFIIAIFVLTEMWLTSTHIDVIKAAPLIWWICLPFATVMMARTITFYGISKFIRRWFVHEEPDSSHAGMNNEPNEGAVEPIGWLIQCPICTGMHSASILFLLYAFFPNFGWTVAVMLAVAAGSMLLHHTAELLSWGSRLMRVLSGFISPDPGTEGYEMRDRIYTFIREHCKEPQ
jgi:hypothetical protein